MWEQVQWAVVESAREECGSVRVGRGRKKPKKVWWNDEIKAAVMRKKVLGARDEDAKERCMGAYRRTEKS